MSQLIYDLHSHTHFSDGKLSPEALLSRAKEKGVNVMAVTDHDTIAGLESAVISAGNLGIGLVSGVEFSCRWGNTTAHILGLCVDVRAPALAEAVRGQEEARERRAHAIAEKLSKAGFAGALEAARAFAGEGVVGRPHFAQHLVAIGAVKDMAAAFKRYLGTGKPADAKFIWPEIADIIQVITSSGGIAVLAHPAKYDLTRTKMVRLIDDFVAAGGAAIEVINGAQQPQITKDLTKLCAQRDLLASCGSDFHMPDLPWQELGRFECLHKSLSPVWTSPQWRYLVQPVLA